ncbi:hypothetical protein AVEN_199558-1, partial [Araneus ventricosus]
FQCAKATPNHIDIDKVYNTATFPTLERKGHCLITYRKCDCVQVPVVRSRLQAGGLQVRNSIPLKIYRVCGPVANEIIRSGQTSSRWCGAEVMELSLSSGVVLVI